MTSAPDPDPQANGQQAEAYRDYARFSLTAAGHGLTFYPAGHDRLAALLDMIGAAQTSLKLFYYLFDSDGSGTQVRDALVAAARRGVMVTLIVDDFGNDAGAEFFAPLVEAGGRFTIFSPTWGLRYLVRNHQKFVIADKGAVMTGGANVSDHYFDLPEENGWCDLSLRIEGPVVDKFIEWFALLQSWVASDKQGNTARLRALRDIVKRWDGEAKGSGGAVRLLVGGPLVRKGHWAWVLRQDLVTARRLDTVSAYFAPPRSFRRLIARAARRGDVRMIMAGKSDIDAAIDMARLQYKSLLAAGARIAEFGPCKLHMKLIVVDDVSYLGSANLDKRSFRINVELMVRIEDAALAAALRQLIDHMEAASVAVTPAWYAAKATFFNRLRWRVAYWLSIADYRVSRMGAG